MRRYDGTRRHMLTVGLTGAMCSGKSTVAAFLRDMGVPVIDADNISRSLTAEGGEAVALIAGAFPETVSGGVVNRVKLASIVFSDESKLRLLESIIHPIVIERTALERAGLCESGEKAAVIEAPLLFESGMDAACDIVVVTSAPLSVLIDRIKKRDGILESEAMARLNRQMPPAEKALKADVVINTDQSLRALRKQTERLWRDIIT